MTLLLAAGAITGGLGLAGCQREPSFDERYDAASDRIEATAREIDARIAGTDAPKDGTAGEGAAPTP